MDRRIKVSVVAVHIRVTLALVFREMAARFGNKPGGYIWALLDPVAHVVIMTALFSALSSKPALGSSFPLFFGSGYLAFQYYQAMSGYVAAAIQANKSLLNYPLVAPIDTVAARIILQAVTTTFVTSLILGTIIALQPDPIQLDWPHLLEGVLAASLLGAGIGLMNVTLFSRYPLYERIFTLISRPMFLLSGVFFLPDRMPHPFVDYLLYNPILHAVMCFRRGIYPEYRSDLLDMGYLYECAFATVLVGLILLTVSSAKLRND